MKKKMFRQFPMLMIGFLLVVGVSGKALADEFYKGKMIRFIVGYSPGGGYDTYTRMVARHISKYIPGNPASIVQNMTGAGSLIAAKYTYSRAKPDGLTVGIWNSAYVLRQALGDPAVTFDVRKFGWLGTPAKATPTCVIMAATGIKTLDDIKKYKRPLRMGATRPGSFLDDLPKILNRTIGTRFDVITGYRGTSHVRLAMQSGEVDGACWQWESIRSTARSMLDAEGDEKLIPFIIHSRWTDPEVKDIPLIPESIKGKDNLTMYNAWVAKSEIHTPFTVSPGTPKKRLAVLQKAFKAVLRDPALLAESKKSKLPVTYVSPEEIEKYLNQILSTPPEVKDKLQFLMRKKKKK